MGYKYYRFFGGMLLSQEKWLNSMAGKGYQLIRTGKSYYEFQKCEPNMYQYKVEFIGQKSKNDADQYVEFLREFGYNVFFKNMNLNYSVGKVVLRPWAEKGGRIATNSTTFNRELLIIEKVHDGKKFELHTTFEDIMKYYKTLCKPWIYMLIFAVILGIVTKAFLVCGIFAVIAVIGILLFQVEIAKLKQESKTREW